MTTTILKPNEKGVLVLDKNEQTILEIGSIPSSVKVLILTGAFNQLLSSGIIPDSVEELELIEFTSSLPSQNILEIGSIPSSVETVTIGNLSQPITKGLIPSSVQDLIFTSSFTQNINHSFIDQDTNVIYWP